MTVKKRNTSRYQNVLMVALVNSGIHKSLMFGSGNRTFTEKMWLYARDFKQELKRIVSVLEIAGCHALSAVDRHKGLKWAEKIVARYNNDLSAQNLWLNCRAKVDGGETLNEFDRDLSQRFCDRPFKWFEIATEEEAFMCCPAWLPVSIGSANNPLKAWNSDIARKIRGSILDGSFRYCSRVHCPSIANKSLPYRKDVAPEPDRYVLDPPPPVLVNLAYDRSCNIACPSCRVTTIVATKSQQERMRQFYNESVAPLIATSEIVNVTGSGDPFGSPHFRWVLREIAAAGGARIDIQTNGVLFDERAWRELGLDGRIRRVLVSLDAARKETYDIVRRGGDFERVLRNVAFLVDQRRQGKITFIGIDFVVQALNFRQIPEFIALGKSLGVDQVRFNMLRDWSTFSGNEFEQHFIGTPQHPDYPELAAILQSAVFSDPIVDPGNMWQFAEGEPQSLVSAEIDGLHA